MLQDLYALAPERTEAAAGRFRAAWLDHFAETADEYEVPRHSDAPDAVYTSADDLIRLLVAHPALEQAIYWTNTRDGLVRTGMLFFTADGGLIAGLSIADEDPATGRQLLTRLAGSIGARHGYATFEQPPSATTAEFLASAVPYQELLGS